MPDSMITKDSLSQKAAYAIKDLIRAFEYPPGTRFVVDKLTERLGISRTPVREGLKELVNQGFVFYNGNSYFVKKYSKEEIGNLFDVRCALEMLSLQLAEAMFDDSDKEYLRRIVLGISASIKKRNPDEIIAKDVLLHDFIVSKSNNRYLLNLAKNTLELCWFVRTWVFKPHFDRISEVTANNEHKAIVNSVVQDRFREANEYLKSHLINAKNRIIARIEDE